METMPEENRDPITDASPTYAPSANTTDTPLPERETCEPLYEELQDCGVNDSMIPHDYSRLNYQQ